MHRDNPISAAQAIEALRRLVAASWSPALSKAKPIVFDFLLEQWVLDPRNPRALFRKGDLADAPLRLTSSPSILLRALTDASFEPEPFEMFAAGDQDALIPIIDALKAKQNVLGLRVNQNAGV
jgi:hypothetical protein